MNDSLLEAVMGRMTANKGRVQEHAHPPVEPKAVRKHAGSFDRWHFAEAPVHEEENWMMTYLDVVTLLLMMLVVMLAFANPSSGPSKAKAAAVAGAVADPLSSILPPVPLPVPRAVKSAPSDGKKDEAEKTSSPHLSDLGEGIQVVRGQRSVSFRISSEVMFASGESALTPAGQALMDRLLPVFNKVPDHTIVVAGHTDNVPIQTARFPSNWELAAGRAASVVRHLETRGLNPTRLLAVGYGDTHPLAANGTPEGRMANRRVEITMEAPPEVKP